MHTITRLSGHDFRSRTKELADLLVDAVDGGASLGFLAPGRRPGGCPDR